MAGSAHLEVMALKAFHEFECKLFLDQVLLLDGLKFNNAYFYRLTLQQAEWDCFKFASNFLDT